MDFPGRPDDRPVRILRRRNALFMTQTALFFVVYALPLFKAAPLILQA